MRATERTVMIKFGRNKTTPLDNQITEVLRLMNKVVIFSEEYSTLMTTLERLYELKVKERRQQVSRDTIVLVAGNLMGILLIVAYEQKHVMTSKGFSQIIKPKTN